MRVYSRPLLQSSGKPLRLQNSKYVFQDQEEQAYFAVFDGHGGVDAANYAANHLHVNLVRQEMFSQDAGEALCHSFKQVCMCLEQNLRCGTTGVVTFLRGRTLYVTWLGDSQVMMVKRGQPVELMKPHKPFTCSKHCSFLLLLNTEEAILKTSDFHGIIFPTNKQTVRHVT